jgi:hypothetical protein
MSPRPLQPTVYDAHIVQLPPSMAFRKINVDSLRSQDENCSLALKFTLPRMLRCTVGGPPPKNRARTTATIRERLIKIGTPVIEQHIAPIRIRLPTSCPVRDLLELLGDSTQCAGQEPTFLRRQIGAALNYLVYFFAALASERPRPHTQACTRTSRTTRDTPKGHCAWVPRPGRRIASRAAARRTKPRASGEFGWSKGVNHLAVIMHDVARFCTSGERARAGDPTG